MQRSSMRLILATLLMGAMASAQDAKLEASFQALAVYEVGKDAAPLDAIEAEVMASARNETARQTVANRLAGLLSTNATFEAKKFACRMLCACGNATQVPALAALLSNETGSNIARLALEKIPGPEANAALVDGLGKSKGLLRAGMVNSLGARRDAGNVPVLTGLLADGDDLVAEAAAVGLGVTGGAAAEAAIAKALPNTAGKVRAALVDAWLKCAAADLAEGKTDAAFAIYQALFQEKEASQVRMAALRGLVLTRDGEATQRVADALASGEPGLRQVALGLVVSLKGAAATQTLVDKLGSLNADTQAALILALGARQDAAALPAVTQACTSTDAAVRIAALNTLGLLGDAGSVAVLAQRAAATEGDEHRIARESLYRVSGAGVDDALLKDIKRAEPKVEVELLRALAERKTPNAVPLLLKEARSAEKESAAEACRGLGKLAGPKDMPALLHLFVKARSAEARDSARGAVVAAAKRIDPKDGPVKEVLKAYHHARKGEVKAALLEAMGEIGCKDALDALRAAAAAKEEALRNAAFKALASWPSPEVIPDLVQLAEAASQNEARDAALDGAIRLERAAGNKPAEQAIAFYTKAAALASSDSTKRHILAGVGEVADLKALEVVNKYAKDPAVEREAAIASEKIRCHFYVATASAAAASAPKAIDGNMETRWDTAAGQKPGQWFQLDLGGEAVVVGLKLDCSPSRLDYPRGYEVYVFSDPNAPGAPVAKGNGDKAVMEIGFAPKPGRYVKIVQTGTDPGLFWSIHELRVITK